jgi:aspartate carbamoyltransferase catalytic subunit
MHHFPSVFESIKDLDLKQIRALMALAGKFKSYSSDWQGLPVPFIRKPLIATSFLENSTRTKHSFAIAIEKLGAKHIDFNAETSSLKKGESLEETLKTLHCQGIDLCIIRTNISEQLAQFKENPPIKIINGGDGTHQHPTQALLDLFTMQEIGFEMAGKTVAIIGDIKHSRVSHSLIDLLPMYGIKIILCGPKICLPEASKINPAIEITTNVDEAIERSDLLYLLRIQKERHKSQDSSQFDNYEQTYGINLERLKKHDKKLPVFHPGPANVGVEISEDVMSSPMYFGYSQVFHSVYMRMAIIQAVLQNIDKKTGMQVESQNISQYL